MASEGEGPRERLRRVGPAALSDEELIALLLGTGSAHEPVQALALRLLSAAGGVRSLSRWGAGALASVRGIGETKGARIVAAFELGRRVHDISWNPGPLIGSSRDIDRLARSRLVGAEVEHFVAFALDSRNRVMSELQIAKGGTTFCPVDPADVYRALLREAATGAVFVHNHPSGDPMPSVDDIALTDRLVRAGSLLGIRVLDHVIIGKDGYFSFLDRGFLTVEREHGLRKLRATTP